MLIMPKNIQVSFAPSPTARCSGSNVIYPSTATIMTPAVMRASIIIEMESGILNNYSIASLSVFANLRFFSHGFIVKNHHNDPRVPKKITKAITPTIGPYSSMPCPTASPIHLPTTPPPLCKIKSSSKLFGRLVVYWFL